MGLISVLGALTLCFLVICIGIWLGNWTFRLGIPKERIRDTKGILKERIRDTKDILKAIANLEGEP